MKFRFAPIDLESAAELAVRFRADSFVCSFGSADRFYEADGRGPERYLAWLRQRMEAIPGSCVHVFHGDQPIGQIELGRLPDDVGTGYVHLFYLAPAYRDRGLGRHLERYAVEFLRELGCQRARLSVSPTNEQALRFYEKNGWRDLGPRPDRPEVHVMERELTLPAPPPLT